MYIEPNSDIVLYKGVKLDKDYENTIYFGTLNAQQTYFNTVTHINLTKYYYQRKDRGYIRVGLPYADVYSVNYMAFKNVSAGSSTFENKWWYAFVDSVEYINDGVTELHYTLDVIQSWITDFTLERCLVERQHSVSDDIGENLVAEDIETGEYVYNDYGVISNDLEELAVVIGISNRDFTNLDGVAYSGIYSGVIFYAFPMRSDHLTSDITLINNFINRFYREPNSVVAMYMCPKKLIRQSDWPTSDPSEDYLAWRVNTNTYYGYQFTVDLTPMENLTTIDGYTPKNNKLFSYPYNLIQLDNAQGNAVQYRYEYFKNGNTGHNPRFIIGGSSMMPVSARVVPYGYKNSGSSVVNTESLTITNYPMCAWNIDTFKAWLAQNAVPIALNVAKLALPIAGAAMGAGVFGVYNGAGMLGDLANYALGDEFGFEGDERVGLNIAKGSRSLARKINPVMGATALINQGYKASLAGDAVQGTMSCGSATIAMRNQNIYCGRLSVRRDYAKIIDDFFTMYGYADKTLHVPMMRARTKWTYVKTQGCQVHGFIPADDKIAIQNIFDNGIRFWTSGDEIGLYYLTNAPLS